tara:strand:+ start:226 stop:483 length:258 start_codon:yes stop_codon:yes gene_type:complete
MNKRNLIVPEDLVIEIMGLVAQIGRVAQDYHQRFVDDDMGTITGVYERIIKKLMDLDEYIEGDNSLEDMLDSYGLKLGDKNERNN